MKADIKGVLKNLNRAYVMFEFDNGKRMTKNQVKTLMEYGLKKGYKTTDDFTEEDERLALEFSEKN